MPSTSIDEYDAALDAGVGIGETVNGHFQKAPHKTAVVDGSLTLSYGELHARATHLARQLRELSIGKEEPVGVVVEHGIADVVAQLAVVYAGGTCVPMDPTLPDEQIMDRLKRLEARVFMTDDSNLDRDLPLHPVNVDDIHESALSQSSTYQPATTTLDHCTHLIHTSGTTSIPKAVRISAKSILHVAYHAPFDPVDAEDVVAHSNRCSFDVSLFDIWAPLLRGASIAVLHKAALLDAPLLAREIDRYGITIMIFPAPLLNLAASTYPRAFAKVKRCIMGGEAANPQALRTIFQHGPPELIVNAYGPTECCAYCLASEITSKDVHGSSISIGGPIGHNIAYIADEDGKASEEGELWVGGPGVTQGYVNQAKKNASAFATVAGFVDKSGAPTRFYRTGDMVRRLEDGSIDFIGRQDHQVQIQGYRIELGAVENGLLKTGLFTEVSAMRVEAPFQGAGALLIAYAVPVSSNMSPNMDEVTQKVKAILPPYMVPHIELISRIPLNSHLKVDRKHLTELFAQRWKPMAANSSKKLDSSIGSKLANIWAMILSLPSPPDQNSADFFQLGGNSLQAALLIDQIRKTFEIEVSLLTLYEHSSLGALESVLSNKAGGQFETTCDESEIWKADSEIADSLPMPYAPVVDWRRDTEGRVFMTGATGFVGAFFLADLLSTSGVHQVGCLVRASGSQEGEARIKATMVKYGIWQDRFADKIVALPGRLEAEDLGLGGKRYAEIANWASVVFHLGARVNYTQPYSLHRPVNTIGTLNMVRFACTGRVKPLHYSSSISCFGPTGFTTGATSVKEDEDLLKHLPAMQYDHGYAQSQWVADQLMKRLVDRGFPIAIYRPGFITGHSESGACNPDDFFSRFIHACQEMGCFPSLPAQRKEFVPVDYVSTIMLHISSSPASVGHAFHIVPPTRQESPGMEDSMKMVGEASHSEMSQVSYAEWIAKLASISPERLRPLQPMLAEKVKDGLTRWELYERMPSYETTNTVEMMADYPKALQFPVLGPAMMKRYLDYLQADSTKAMA